MFTAHRFTRPLAAASVSLALSSQTAEPASATPETAPPALDRYVARKDDSFDWSLRNTTDIDGIRLYELELVSQTWQDIVWRHTLHVFEPPNLHHPRHLLLFVTGGAIANRPQPDPMGAQLARLAGARTAMLHQVPNQPLFDNRFEDDLITETWLRYLETGDETWPLLFPMVKSAVRAMDALQAFAAEHRETDVEGFVITGASKRGWTSWLTPAVDTRVVATAPLVIDTLNFRAQMQHQLDTWGAYSKQIHDYTDKGLVKTGEESPRETRLRLMMDPYSYRDRVRVPKLLVNGTNDPYWVVDAMKYYWYDLVGPRYVLQVPNAGHGLEGGRETVLRTVAAFFRHTVSDTPLPELDWCHADAGDETILRVTASPTPETARLWLAASPTADFRKAEWHSRTLHPADGRWTARIPHPETGHTAHFAELVYTVNNLTYSLCTLVHRH